MKTNKDRKLSWEKPVLVDLTDDVKTAHGWCGGGGSDHWACSVGGAAQSCYTGRAHWGWGHGKHCYTGSAKKG